MDSNTQPPYRVALYYAPATDSAWWNAGSEWLGRCARTDQPLPQPPIAGMAPEALHALTAEPRRYGWHATLKAPFVLQPGRTLEDVRAAVRHLCAGREPFTLTSLQVSRMGAFLALRPLRVAPELQRLANDCVRQLQPLAQPLSDDELARRRRTGLTPEQDRLLRDWGYPFVMEHFRFHMTLTGPLQGLSAPALAALLEATADRFHALPACPVDRISLFVEPTPGAPFRLLEQIPFQP